MAPIRKGKKKSTGIEKYGKSAIDEALGLSDGENYFSEDVEHDDEQDVFALPSEKYDGGVPEKRKKTKKMTKKARAALAKAEAEKEEESEEEPEYDAEFYDRRTAWGKDEEMYYGGSDAGDSDAHGAEASEDEKAYEQEAAFLQDQRMSRLNMEDFGLDDLPDAEADEAEVQRDDKTHADELEEVARDLEFSHVEKVTKDFSKMTEKQKRKVLLKINKEFKPLIVAGKDCVDQLGSAWLDLKEKKASMTEAGAKYADTKYIMSLAYLMNFSYYLALKAKGTSVTMHPVIGRLMELREGFEKIKAVDTAVEEDVAALLEEDDEEEVESSEEEEVAPAPVAPVKAVKASRAQLVQRMLAKTNKSAGPLSVSEMGVGDLLKLPSSKKRKASKLDGHAEAADLDDFDPSLGARKGSGKNAAAALNSLKLEQQSAKKKSKSADDDVDFREKKSNRIRESDWDNIDKPMFGGGDLDMAEMLMDGTAPEQEVESEGELERKAAKAARKEERRIAAIKRRLPPQEVEVTGHRKVNREIEKNRGLVRQRKKIDRNPRVKKRVRYEKMMKSRRGAVQEMREGRADGGYDGEATGVRKNLKKSIKLT